MSSPIDPTPQTPLEAALTRLLSEANEWYEEHRKNDKVAKTNTINAGLAVSRMVRDGLPITPTRLVSEGGSQVRGISGSQMRTILADHGETRKYTSEGGRTSRATLPKAKGLVDRWNAVNIPEVDYESLAFQLEEFFVDKARKDYFDKKRLKVDINPSRPVATTVREVLQTASQRADRPTGAVLQHLVGAKLELRFPATEIGRDKANTADQQTDREGDFQVGTTAFHVTVSPMEKLMERCKDNIISGIRPTLVVPEAKVSAARQLAEVAGISDQVSVTEAESFIGTNIEEIAKYDTDSIKEGLARLIRRYNERITEIEPDLSLRIDEPGWLVTLAEKQGF